MLNIQCFKVTCILYEKMSVRSATIFCACTAHLCATFKGTEFSIIIDLVFNVH